MIPELDATTMADPVPVYEQAREQSPLVRLVIPGMTSMWVVTRHEHAKTVLADPRFELAPGSYLRLPVDPELTAYLRTMGEMNGEEHARLRRLVAPAFTARRAGLLRPAVERAVARRLAERPADLAAGFAQPLPMDVICELVGVPEADRPAWSAHGTAIAAGAGPAFIAAIPDIIAGAKATIAHRREHPADDLLSHLIHVHDSDGLTDTELVALVWHLVLAGQTPSNLITNAVEALLAAPDQLARLRADPELMPTAVEELTRWCTPQLLTVPRFPTEDVTIDGRTIPRGEPTTVAIAAVNRDPRAHAPGWDVARPAAQHLAFGHGPHYCLGASLARLTTEVAIGALLDAKVALDGDITRANDPGTWRVAAMPVRFG
jgi:cytochrome P450